MKLKKLLKVLTDGQEVYVFQNNEHINDYSHLLENKVLEVSAGVDEEVDESVLIIDIK